MLLRVLTYHRIADSRAFPLLTNVSADEQNFEAQLRFLVAHYDVVSIDDVIHAISGETRLPSRAVLVTFDDAYWDFGETAWPLLRMLNVPVTLFVPTAYPGDPDRVFWWDRLKRSILLTSRQHIDALGSRYPLTNTQQRIAAYLGILHRVEELRHEQGMEGVDAVCRTLGEQPIAPPVLGWAELRQLASQGVALAPHTRTHPILTRVSREQAAEEIAGSRDDLVREIGKCAPVFAYPAGKHDATTVGVVKEHGFVLGFTTVAGHNDLRKADPLRLSRTNIGAGTTLLAFQLRLNRAFSYVDSMRLRYKERTPKQAA